MKSKAFTLLEVFLVIIILVTVFFPLLQMLSRGLVVGDEVKGTNTAVIIAQKRMEELKNTAFASISGETKTTVASYPAYSRQVNVTTPQANLKDVLVIVYWKPGSGQEMSISIESFISNF